MRTFSLLVAAVALLVLLCIATPAAADRASSQEKLAKYNARVSANQQSTSGQCAC